MKSIRDSWNTLNLCAKKSKQPNGMCIIIKKTVLEEIVELLNKGKAEMNPKPKKRNRYA
jgi:hypothetical protein